MPLNLSAVAPSVPYTPGTPSNWSPIPASVQQALDDLAASSPTGGTETVGKYFFTFATSFPLAVGTVATGALVNDTQLLITTPFSAGATLAFGTTLTSALILSGADIDAQQAGTYRNDALIPFAGSASLILSGSMAGATAGAGWLLFKVR